MSRTDSVRIRRPGRGRLAVLLLLVVAGALLAVTAFVAGPAPTVEIVPTLPAIGQRTPVEIRLAEPSRGLAGFRVELVQGQSLTRLVEETLHPAPFLAFWADGTAERSLRLEIGKATIPTLVGGEATVRVVAERAPALLRHPAPVVRELTLPVRLTPPRLEILSTQTYVVQGGSEAVVYRVGESSVRDGVAAGDWFFPGQPLPGGGPRDRFALFSAPWDVADGSGLVLVATDDVGNEARASFVDRFTARPARPQTLQLSDRFLTKVVSEILAETPALADQGDLVKNYLAINGDLRRANAAELRELAAETQAKFLWREPFFPFPGSQVMASFADHRSYLYQDRVIDQQDHLGFDLASVARAPIPAANDGVVRLARFLGIYGNTVVIDHGYGLMSLYSHLSSISVQPGQTVRRGDEIGKTGATGMAGGDHLHFSFLLHGLPVNPAEWWDAHWIRDRIGRKLGPALPFKG
jgi:murein DD-endopeptidase MepM/ murein hydrolase activator NlpD